MRSPKTDDGELNIGQTVHVGIVGTCMYIGMCMYTSDFDIGTIVNKQCHCQVSASTLTITTVVWRITIFY